MVYIDDMNAPYRGMLMCHMIADTHAELIEMARKIGVNRKHIQKAGTRREHFDICATKKTIAVKNGAVSVTWRQLGNMVLSREAHWSEKYFSK